MAECHLSFCSGGCRIIPVALTRRIKIVLVLVVVLVLDKWGWVEECCSIAPAASCTRVAG
jgi:hypothetical protein